MRADDRSLGSDRSPDAHEQPRPPDRARPRRLQHRRLEWKIADGRIVAVRHWGHSFGYDPDSPEGVLLEALHPEEAQSILAQGRDFLEGRRTPSSSSTGCAIERANGAG